MKTHKEGTAYFGHEIPTACIRKSDFPFEGWSLEPERADKNTSIALSHFPLQLKSFLPFKAQQKKVQRPPWAGEPTSTSFLPQLPSSEKARSCDRRLSAEEIFRARMVTLISVPSLTTAQVSHPLRSQPREDSSFPRYWEPNRIVLKHTGLAAGVLCDLGQVARFPWVSLSCAPGSNLNSCED